MCISDWTEIQIRQDREIKAFLSDANENITSPIEEQIDRVFVNAAG